MTVTATKTVLAFRVLTMTVDLSRLTSGTMNSNAGYDKTSTALLYITSTNWMHYLVIDVLIALAERP